MAVVALAPEGAAALSLVPPPAGAALGEPLGAASGAALALGAALVSVAGVFDFGVSPPQATRTADVPSAASVAARFESERFGRMLMFFLFTYF